MSSSPFIGKRSEKPANRAAPLLYMQPLSGCYATSMILATEMLLLKMVPASEVDRGILNRSASIPDQRGCVRAFILAKIIQLSWSETTQFVLSYLCSPG